MHPWRLFFGLALVFLGFSTDAVHAFDRRDFPLRIYINPELHGDGFRQPLDPLVLESLRQGVADWPRMLAVERNPAQKAYGIVLHHQEEPKLTELLLSQGFLRLVEDPEVADLVIEVSDQLPSYTWETGAIKLRSRWRADPRHRLGRLQLARFESWSDRRTGEDFLDRIVVRESPATPMDNAMDLRLLLVRELGFLLGLRAIPPDGDLNLSFPLLVTRSSGLCNVMMYSFLVDCRQASPGCESARSDTRCLELGYDQMKTIEGQLRAEPGKGTDIASLLLYQQAIASEIEEIALLVAGPFERLGCVKVQVDSAGKTTGAEVMMSLKDSETDAALLQRIRRTVFTPVPPALTDTLEFKVFLMASTVSDGYRTRLERQVTDRFAPLVPKGKSTRLQLRLADSGALVSAKVLESTGDARLDATLLERLGTLAPFAPLDLRYRERYAEVRIEGRAESALP